jgi:hypothetical protein
MGVYIIGMPFPIKEDWLQKGGKFQQQQIGWLLKMNWERKRLEVK